MNKSIKIVLFFCISFVFIGSYSCENNQKNVQGKSLYVYYCANCHMEDGNGFAKLYPPVNNSDYMVKHYTDLPCIIRHGLKGEIMVNNTEFDLDMPPIPELNEVEITNIINYISQAWSNDLPGMSFKEVQERLLECQ